MIMIHFLVGLPGALGGAFGSSMKIGGVALVPCVFSVGFGGVPLMNFLWQPHPVPHGLMRPHTLHAIIGELIILPFVIEKK